MPRPFDIMWGRARDALVEEDDQAIITKLGGKGINLPRSPMFTNERFVGGSARSRQKGYMTVGEETVGTPWVFRFLFNPTEVGYNYAVVDRLDSDLQGGSAEVVSFLKGASVNFSLILDRSHEVAEARRPLPAGIPDSDRENTNFAEWSPQRIGVLHDVAVFNLVIVGGADFAQDGSSPGVALQGRKVQLNLSPGASTSLQRLRFEGYITSTDIQFQRFTPDMIPTMGTLNITLQRTYDDSGSAATEQGLVPSRTPQESMGPSPRDEAVGAPYPGGPVAPQSRTGSSWDRGRDAWAGIVRSYGD